MKLHYSPTSPYVRKVCILALETGLHDDLEQVAEKLTPVAPSDGVNQGNPLGKISTVTS